jgi:hypothetical protein
MAFQERGQTAIVVGKSYDLMLWLLPKVEKFPRSYRFSVGDRVLSDRACSLMPRSRAEKAPRSTQAPSTRACHNEEPPVWP